MSKTTVGCVLQMITLMSFSSAVMLTSNLSEKYALRVSNGIPAHAGEIPYQIALKLAMDPFHFRFYTICGGALIGQSKILTAAHCFFSEKAKDFCDCSDDEKIKLSKMSAVAGTLRNIGQYQRDEAGTEQWRRMNVTLIHPLYNFPLNDVALGFTKRPFVLNLYVSTVPYARWTADYGEMQCKVSGYGRVSQFITSDSLLWAYLTLIPKFVCHFIHGRNMADFICTSSDHSDVLRGDSGGPLVCRLSDSSGEKDVVVGIVCGVRLGHGTFFTRVSSYSEFLEQNISTRLKTTSLCVLLANYIRVLLILLLFSNTSASSLSVGKGDKGNVLPNLMRVSDKQQQG